MFVYILTDSCLVNSFGRCLTIFSSWILVTLNSAQTKNAAQIVNNKQPKDINKIPNFLDENFLIIVILPF